MGKFTNVFFSMWFSMVIIIFNYDIFVNSISFKDEAIFHKFQAEASGFLRFKLI